MELNKLDQYVKFFSFILKYYNSDVLKSASSTALGEDTATETSNYDQKPEELVEDLKKMGPTYVKLGQLLSTRPDLLPAPYLAALASLQDDVETIEYSQIEEIIEEQLGTKINKAFTLFDPEPLASASIGQVHRALLPSGRMVAVKIQRPGVDEKFKQDLATLREVSTLAVKHSSVARQYALDQIIEELEYILLNELNYEKEFHNLITLRENLHDFDLLFVPEPVAQYSSSRVLTMDFVEGRKVTSLGPLAVIENNFTPLVEQLVHAYLKQIIVDGFAHADPHPGNVVLTSRNQIALMDLGMVAKFSGKMQEQILELMMALSNRDGDKITDALIAMSDHDPQKVDLDAFRKDINRLVMDHTSTQAQDMATGRVVIQMNRIAAEHGLHLAVELNILGKILLNMDQIVAALAPEYDLQKSIRSYMEELVNSKMKQELKPENIYRVLLDHKKLAEELPGRLNRITEQLSEGQLELKINAIDEDRLTDGFQKVANRITSGLIIAAMIIGAALLMRVESTYSIMGYGLLPFVFFMIATALGLYLLYQILFKDKSPTLNKKR